MQCHVHVFPYNLRHFPEMLSVEGCHYMVHSYLPVKLHVFISLIRVLPSQYEREKIHLA